MSELRVVFLGTGSARPTPRRGVSAVAITYGADTLLFDCGEGTQIQVLKAGVRTSHLRGIFISHFHGDHINGLPGFIGTMGLHGHREPIALVGPRGLNRYLEVLRDLSILHPSFRLELGSNRDGEVFAASDYRVFATQLTHRIQTHGYLFREHDRPGRFLLDRALSLGVPAGPLYGKLQRGEAVTLADGRVVLPAEVMGPGRAGRTIAYVPDTRPCEAAVELARGADVLIHDSTYTHDHVDQAVERGHSTAREAAMVARDAGVRKLVLTHFSPKVHPRELLSEARAVFEPVVLAEDFDSLQIPVPE